MTENGSCLRHLDMPVPRVIDIADLECYGRLNIYLDIKASEVWTPAEDMNCTWRLFRVFCRVSTTSAF